MSNDLHNQIRSTIRRMLYATLGIPMLALPVALWLVYYRSVQSAPPGLQEVAWSYIAASLTYSCVPSKADIAIVFSKPIGLMVYLASGALLYWMRLTSS